jgi:CubicO group peptidase (beta-lactamase class C family)
VHKETAMLSPLARRLALLILTLGWVVPTAWGAPQVINAKVVKVDAKSRSIDIEVKGQLYAETLTLEENAKVEINGERANLQDLSAGMQVTVIGDLKTKKATRISAKGTSPAGKPTRRPPPKPASGKDKVEPIEARGPLAEPLRGIDDVVQAFMNDQEIRGGAVVIVKDGKGVFARGYGFADKAKKIPADPNTLFPLDGISKVITGVVIAQLAEQGKIDLAAEFFDALGTKPTDDEDDLPDNSRFVDATTLDLLKNPIRFQRDSFFKEYLEDSDFRKKINDRIKSMPGGSKIELRKFIKYDPVDLQYLLLGRLISKATGKDYQEGVQETLLGPLQIASAKVVVLPLEKEDDEDRANPSSPSYGTGTRERSREKRVQAKKEEEKEKQKKKEALYEGVAQVQFQAGRDYEVTSMSLDAAGSWVASPIELAKLARAIEKPADAGPLKVDGLRTLLSPAPLPVSSSDDDDDDDEKKTPTSSEGRLRSARYFASGWFVTRPTSEDDNALIAARRSVHSGPVAILSEPGLQIVLATTTGFSASKSGEEHPLMVELLDAVGRVKDWPKEDLLGPAPGTPATTDVAETMPADGSTGDRKRTIPKLPVVASLGQQIEETVNEFLSAYEKFLAAGGSKILAEIQQTASPDFARIAQRVPDGAAAVAALEKDYIENLIGKSIAPQAMVPQDKPDQKEAADALMSYGQSISRLVNVISRNLQAGTSGEQAKPALAEFHKAEEFMYAELSRVLEKVDAAFPSEPQPAGSDADFERVLGRVMLRVKALDQKFEAFTASQFGQIDSIQAKAGGATPDERALLPTLIKVVQIGSLESATAFQRYVDLTAKYVELEKGANSKYLPVWEKLNALAQALTAYATFMGDFGKENFKAEDQQTHYDTIDAAKKALAEARQTLAQPESAPPPTETPPTAATPNPAP